MSDLIDRKVLLNDIVAHYPQFIARDFKPITSAPVVEAVEVRHGEWGFRSNGHNVKRSGDYEEWYECSVCKSNADSPTDFCPNCGALMDGKRRESEGNND